ncbi:MAG: hypothetical protein U1C97_02045, partial [Candidatus Gracilibacteria bacterium]|nr:hypothetical protein [Candidatus Gracilibacteria bacterium]
MLEKRIAELEQQLTLRKIQTESTEQSQEERSEPEEPQIEPIVILDNDAQTPSTEESEKPEMDFDTAQKTLKENLEASLESNDDRLFISDGKVAEAAEVYYKTIRRGSNAKYLPLEVQVPGEEDQLMWHQRTYDLEKNTSSGRWEILLRWNNGEFTGLSKPTLLRNRQDYLEAFDYIQQNIREEDVVTELGIITDPHLLNALEVIAPEPKYHLIVSKQSGAEAGTKDELVIVWKRSPEDDEDRVLTIDVDHLSAQNSDDPYRTEQSSIPLKTIKLEGALKKRVNEQRSQIKLQRINILLPNIECSTYLGLAMREF